MYAKNSTKTCILNLSKRILFFKSCKVIYIDVFRSFHTGGYFRLSTCKLGPFLCFKNIYFFPLRNEIQSAIDALQIKDGLGKLFYTFFLYIFPKARFARCMWCTLNLKTLKILPQWNKNIFTFDLVHLLPYFFYHNPR